MGWYQRRVHGEGAQFRNGNHPPSRQTRGGGSHPLSPRGRRVATCGPRLSPLSRPGTHNALPAATPSFTRGRRGGLCVCVCVCALTTDFTAERRGFLSWISLMRPTNSPEPPRSGKFFPKNHFTQDLSPLTERASCHTNRQKSSTAMRVVSRAGDSEARPLQRY